MAADWWVDEESGSLIHTQGDAEPIYKSENVSHLGDDGMFGEEGKKIENQNYESGVGELHVSPEYSKEIAESADHKVVPVEIETVENVKTLKTYGPVPNTTTYGDVIKFETKVSYVPDSYEEIERSPPKYSKVDHYKTPTSSTRSKPTVYKERIYYGKKSRMRKTRDKIEKYYQRIGDGNHGYTDPFVIKHPLRR